MIRMMLSMWIERLKEGPSVGRVPVRRAGAGEVSRRGVLVLVCREGLTCYGFAASMWWDSILKLSVDCGQGAMLYVQPDVHFAILGSVDRVVG